MRSNTTNAEICDAYADGYRKGCQDAEIKTVDKACDCFREYLLATYVAPPRAVNPLAAQDTLMSINEPEMYRMQCINILVYKFRKTIQQ